MTTGRMARLQFESMRREAASLRIQKQARTYICQTAYKNLCISAVYIQTELRAMAALVELQYRKKRQAAIIIQASFKTSFFMTNNFSFFLSINNMQKLLIPQSQIRRCLCRRRYLRMKKAAITTQCGWRVKVARRELRKLKMVTFFLHLPWNLCFSTTSLDHMHAAMCLRHNILCIPGC